MGHHSSIDFPSYFESQGRHRTGITENPQSRPSFGDPHHFSLIDMDRGHRMDHAVSLVSRAMGPLLFAATLGCLIGQFGQWIA